MVSLSPNDSITVGTRFINNRSVAEVGKLDPPATRDQKQKIFPKRQARRELRYHSYQSIHEMDSETKKVPGCAGVVPLKHVRNILAPP